MKSATYEQHRRKHLSWQEAEYLTPYFGRQVRQFTFHVLLEGNNKKIKSKTEAAQHERERAAWLVAIVAQQRIS